MEVKISPFELVYVIGVIYMFIYEIFFIWTFEKKRYMHINTAVFDA